MPSLVIHVTISFINKHYEIHMDNNPHQRSPVLELARAVNLQAGVIDLKLGNRLA